MTEQNHLVDTRGVAAASVPAPAAPGRTASVPHPFVLTLSCPRRPGIVHAVSSFLLERGCDIIEHQQFDDPVRGQLFLRTAFFCAEDTNADRLSAAFGSLAGAFGMTYQVTGNQPPRVLVMVSKLGHCLNDLIFRWRAGSLGAELVAVVSNHEDLRPMAEAAGTPRRSRCRGRCAGTANSGSCSTATAPSSFPDRYR